MFGTMGLEYFILLPVGLGLFGFVEPCTVGAHLIFLGAHEGLGLADKGKAFGAFVVARLVITGAFGAMIAGLGETLIGVQTGFWLGFGAIYVILGFAFLTGKKNLFKVSLQFSPRIWRHATNPFVMGLAFGLNIPACAAPILFGLLAMTATAGTAMKGFGMMALFGLALSAPLAFFLFVPRFNQALSNVRRLIERRSWIIGMTFLLLGLWSAWFGLFVDPVDWSRI